MGKKQIQLITRVSIILIPTYSVAFVTEAMIYTMPMLAACTLVAANLYDEKENENRVDEDGVMMEVKVLMVMVWMADC